MRIKDLQLPDSSVQALRSARKQLQAVIRAQKRYRLEQAARPLVKSPYLDGMPRGSPSTSGLERRYIGLEAFQQRMEQEERRLKAAREEAQRVIYTLPDILQDFCWYYYIEGMDMQAVSMLIERDISTCWRYKRGIEQNAA